MPSLVIRLNVAASVMEAYDAIDAALDAGTIQDAIADAAHAKDYADLGIESATVDIDVRAQEDDAKREAQETALDRIEEIVRLVARQHPAIEARSALRLALTEVGKLRSSLDPPSTLPRLSS